MFRIINLQLSIIVALISKVSMVIDRPKQKFIYHIEVLINLFLQHQMTFSCCIKSNIIPHNNCYFYIINKLCCSDLLYYYNFTHNYKILLYTEKIPKTCLSSHLLSV